MDSPTAVWIYSRAYLAELQHAVRQNISDWMPHAKQTDTIRTAEYLLITSQDGFTILSASALAEKLSELLQPEIGWAPVNLVLVDNAGGCLAVRVYLKPGEYGDTKWTG